MAEETKRVCLICNESVISDSQGQGESSNGDGEIKDDLKSQLSTFFMLRKVLGLSLEFLESLLRSFGSPVQWKIKLCRLCKRLFKEAEYLWDRMNQLQRDYAKVTFEIKDALISSLSPQENELIGENADVDRRNATLVEMLKAAQVTEGVRLKFLMDLQDDETSQDTEIPVLSSAMITKNSSKKCPEMRCSDKCVPYLSLVDFEKNIKDLVDIAAAAENSLKTCVPSTSTAPPIPRSVQQSQDMNKQPAPDVSNERESCQFISHESLTSSSHHTECKVDGLISINQGTSADELRAPPKPELVIVEESLISIVRPDTIMETEKESEDIDSFPQVLEVVKVDFDEGLIDVVDPLIADNAEDPDYVPSTSNTRRPSTSKNSSRKSEVGKSKFDSRKIKAVKKSPKVYECSKCLATFESRCGCQIHIFRDHYGEQLPFHCNFCSEKFLVYHALREHVYGSHGSSETPYDDELNVDSPQVAEQREDDVSNEQGPLKNTQEKSALYICPVVMCRMKFKTSRALQLHATSYHAYSLTKLRGQEIQPSTKVYDPPGLDCNLCVKRAISYRAPNKDLLELHYKKVHSGYIEEMRAKIIQGKIIQPTSDSKQKLRKQRSMRCPDCKKLLPNIRAMAEHFKNPEHKCSDCSKHFLFEIDLRKHLELEHYERNFFCPYCTKTFTSLTVYEKHVENHKIYDIHECQVCHVKITGFSNLNTHIATLHPEFAEQGQSVQLQEPQNPEIFGL